MYEHLSKIENAFQSHLRGSAYTVIAPTQDIAYQNFLRVANRIAPRVSLFRSIHHVLANKAAVRKTLTFFPATTPLAIFVITPTSNKTIFGKETLESYCSRNNINFNPLLN